MKNTRSSDLLCERDRKKQNKPSPKSILLLEGHTYLWIICGKTDHLFSFQLFIVFHQIPVLGCFRFFGFEGTIKGWNMGEVQDVRDVKKTFVAPAIKSFEHYDFSRAKMCCSLTWLVAKAYGTGRFITAPTATVNRTQHESVYDFNAFLLIVCF